MNVAKIGQNFSGITNKIGTNLLNGKCAKAVKFFESDGANIGTIAFNTLIMSTVIIPRLIQARDADERREILTRDSITILTLLFALKGAKAGLSKLASKSNGLVLTNKNVVEGNIFKKLFDFVRPSGISSLTGSQVTSKYGQITDRNGLVKLVEYLNKNGGDPSKALNIKDLADATAKSLGDIKGKSGEEILNAIKNAPDDKLKPLIDILKEVDNPLTKIGKHVNAWLEAGSFATIMGFLGFGIPALNKAITAKNHAKNKALNRTPLPPPLYARHNKNQKDVSKQFMA